MAKNSSWGGRFNEGPKEAVAAYTESVSFDKALYEHDIRGSQAHARMLAKAGVLKSEEAEALVAGLNKIKVLIEENAFEWSEALEDVHMNIESRLTKEIGDVGKKLHTGRSRNDQVCLGFRLFVSDRLRAWRRLLLALVNQFLQRAAEHKDTLLPGCTHMQPAQPVLLGHHLMAYAWMLKRDIIRIEDCEKKVRVSPLGAAALAGTTYPLSPKDVAEDLGMYGIFDNSMDAVADRDFVMEALFCASCTMMHLSRFCEEIIIWANPSFGFVKLPDGYATGSSIMPQKKNPDVAELMRGKVGRVYGDLIAMMTIMKGLPMTYNRDLQEDKEPFLDADQTLSASLHVMEGMLSELTFETRRMHAACKAGFLNATELADYLVGKGVPFREAHGITGRAVALAESMEKTLEDLSLDEFRKIDNRIENDVYTILDYMTAVRRRQTPGSTGPESVAYQIEKMAAWLKEQEARNI